MENRHAERFPERTNESGGKNELLLEMNRKRINLIKHEYRINKEISEHLWKEYLSF